MSGTIFIVAAPSGAGKSSLVNAVLAQDDRIQLSVSYTTRQPRPGEVDGREYHFVDKETFQAMAAHGDFLESAEVHGNYYGTSKRWLAETRRSGRDIVLEIDWQGARQVRTLFPDAVNIFILPPSMAELERRLRGRGKDAEATIVRRLANAVDEISHAHEFEYVIINNDFQIAQQDLAAVIAASRRRPESFLSKLDTSQR